MTFIITTALNNYIDNNNSVSYKQNQDFTLFLFLLLTIADRNRKHISIGGRGLRWAASATASQHRLVSVLEFYDDLIGFQWTNQNAELDQLDGRARSK